MPGRLLYCLAHVVLAVQVEDIRHKVKGILIVLDFGIETGQIETVCQVFLIDFAEVFIST